MAKKNKKISDCDGRKSKSLHWAKTPRFWELRRQFSTIALDEDSRVNYISIVMEISLTKNVMIQLVLMLTLLLVGASFSLSRVFDKITN